MKNTNESTLNLIFPAVRTKRERDVLYAVHIAHGVPLEAEFVRVAQENIVIFLVREWNIVFWYPCRIGIRGTLKHPRVQEHWCRAVVAWAGVRLPEKLC